MGVAMLMSTGRDKKYLKLTDSYSYAILMDGNLINMLPRFLKGIMGPLITWRGKTKCEAAIDMLLPLVEERLNLYRSQKDADNKEMPVCPIPCGLAMKSSSS
jgi:hypothetical protein